MDVADLKTFEAVARHGSMNKAAAELHTVQSNVTARIRALEDALGTQLFERHARGVSVTAAGQRILPFVPRIARLIAEARAAARDDGVPGGTLALGSLETTTAWRLSPLLTEFARAYPAVRLTVTAGSTASLVRDVAASQMDGAFVAGPVSHPDLHQERVFTEELVLATSLAIPSPRALASLPDPRIVVFQSGCSYRQRLESYLASLGIVVARPLEFGSLDAIVSCVSAGVGVTLLPRGVLADAAAAGRIALHRMPRELARVDTLFIRREDAYVTSAMQAFLAMIRQFHGKPAAPTKPQVSPRKAAALQGA